MKAHTGLVFLVFCLNGFFYAHTKQFALLVATTKTWLHYGHQSSVLHAYQTLIANGFPRNNIITMFYDDIANHNNNPEPGIIRNQPQGKNVYENVKKDYTGEKVTAKNFLAVLSGNASEAQGPVFKNTGPRDTLFIYLVGLASYQYVTFPTGTGITARKLTETLQDLTKQRKFRKIFAMVDLSYASTLFQDYLSEISLSPKSKVFVSASTNSREHPHAVYCFQEKRICHGSLYGVAWTQYSDRLRQLKSGAKRTLYDQFNHVRAETPYTHVNMYGDLSIGKSLLREFIAYKHEGKPNGRDAAASSTTDVKLGLAKSDLDDTISGEKHWSRMLHLPNHDQLLNAEEKNRVEQTRNYIEETMKNIFDRLTVASKYKHILPYESGKRNGHFLTEHHSQVYETAIREFHERCININENPVALQEISKLAYLCENNVDENDLITAIADTCTYRKT